MEPVGKVMNKAGSYQGLRERAEQERRQGLDDNHPIWDVWLQIKSAYPGPTVNWDDEPPMIWAYAIDGLTETQVANGIKNLVHHSSEFPPSAGQFKDLCLNNYEWESRAQRITSGALGIESKSHLTDAAQEAGKAFFKGLEWAK